jgi:hypothetical protein
MDNSDDNQYNYRCSAQQVAQAETNHQVVQAETNKNGKAEFVLQSQYREELSFPIQLEYDIGDYVLELNPDLVMKYIQDQTIKAKIAPVLIIITGLPDSKKTTAIQAVLQRIIQQSPDSSLANARDQTSKSINKFELVAARNSPENAEIVYEDVKIGAFAKAIHSAFENLARVRGNTLFYDKFASLKNISFTNIALNKHFKEVYSALSELIDVQTQTEKGKTKFKRKLSEWDRCITSGLAIINVWDVGFSKVADFVLPRLSGHLTNSFTWMFLDLMRDVHNLYKAPDLPENKSRNDKQLLMRWRARVHYFLRMAKLASSLDPDNKRSNVCHLVASHSSYGDVTSKIKQLEKSIESAARQMHVRDLIDSDIALFKESDEKCIKALEKLFKRIIHQQMDNRKKIPLSFIFLRSSFYACDKIYIEKSEMHKAANELKMSDEDFEHFCQLFTSYGSIIDVTLIDPSSNLIILKPVKFINDLEKLFYCSPEVDTRVAEYGIVTHFTAKTIFEENASAYMKFLVSLNLAVELPSTHLGPTADLQEDSTFYFVPNACNRPPVLVSNPNSLQWLRDINRPMLHLKLLFTQKFLKNYPECKLLFEAESCINITQFSSPTSSAADGVKFDLVYLGDSLEFQLSDDNEDQEVCQQILETCKNLLPANIRYNFAIMCRANDDRPDKLQRKHHFLPLNTVQSCTKCSFTTAIRTWSTVLEQENYKVPDGQMLNGDFLTSEEGFRVCEKLTGLSFEAANTLARLLGFDDGFSQFCINPHKPKWTDYMRMILAWERKPIQDDQHHSKKKLAEIMHSLSKDAILLKEAAVDIDLTVEFERN